MECLELQKQKRELADAIIEAQVKEIAQMEMLLEDIEENGEQGSGEALPARSAELTPELRRKARADAGLTEGE